MAARAGRAGRRQGGGRRCCEEAGRLRAQRAAWATEGGDAIAGPRAALTPGCRLAAGPTTACARGGAGKGMRAASRGLWGSGASWLKLGGSAGAGAAGAAGAAGDVYVCVWLAYGHAAKNAACLPHARRASASQREPEHVVRCAGCRLLLCCCCCAQPRRHEDIDRPSRPARPPLTPARRPSQHYINNTL
jgi:hypothetical protein